ncbi:MAG: V4R domain-containing protein [Thermoplasmata archaeon]
MRFVKLSQREYKQIRKLYESVMSQACYGLFYREGMILGDEMALIAQQESEEYFEVCAKLLKAKGWVEDVKFEDGIVTVTGSIESLEPDTVGKVSCHRMRGILKKIYEGHRHKQLHCEEIECVAKGDKQCVFKLEEVTTD